MPQPTAVKHSWFPASVTLNGEIIARNAKVYATDAGLMVYNTVPTDPSEPDWTASIDYDASARPSGPARNGHTMHTSAGTVTVTSRGGCGCGNPLKRWTPDYARKVVRW